MNSSTAQIGFRQIGIGGVLKQYRLRVPPNQRDYSWTDREVVTMLQDFAKAIADGDSSYFLGTIVAIPRSADTLEVIDGQQRLATTAIFLAQVRNHLATDEPLIANSISTEFLTAVDRQRRVSLTRLQLNLDDNDYFQSLITSQTTANQPRRSSHVRIRSAFRRAKAQIHNVVGPYDENAHGDILNSWVTFIEHHAQVILLTVPSDINAYKMFETLNDRGLKTSQSDLVKNYLFGQSGARLSEAQQKWTFLRGTLETLDDDDITVTFLRHALISMTGYLREPQVYEVVQRQAKGEQQTISLLNSLEDLATVYVAIPEHEKWNNYPDTICRAIQALNLLNIRPFRPLMLSVASAFSPAETAAAFASFVSWGVRLLIASSTRSGSVENPLAEAAKLVSEGRLTTAAALKQQLATVIPADVKFRQGFEFASVSKASLARYYLRSLESMANDDNMPYFIPNDDRQTINLEHVLPRQPDPVWLSSFTEESARINARRIGNLALMLATDNSTIRSEGFETKRPLYEDSPYVLTQEIASVSEWNEEAISARQKRLADLAVTTWPM